MLSFERIFTSMTKPKHILMYLTLVILSYYFFDKLVSLWLYKHHVQELLMPLKGLTILGESSLVLTVLVSIALIFRFIKPKQLWEERAWFLCLCVLIPNLICLVLKVLLGRARPELFLQEGVYGFFGFHTQSIYWSLPSGHTTTMMSLAFGLSILFPRRTMLFLVAASCIVLTRVLLLKHYVSDVMTAFFLALIEIGILELVLKRYQYFKLVKKNSMDVVGVNE